MVDLRAEYRVLGRKKTATVDDNHQLCKLLFIALQSCRAPLVRGLRQVGQELDSENLYIGQYDSFWRSIVYYQYYSFHHVGYPQYNLDI